MNNALEKSLRTNALVTVLASLCFLGAAPANAGVVFFDAFNNLSNWTPSGSAVIVADPLNGSNNVVHFTSPGSGGDAFTGIATPGLFAAGRYVLDFDILGLGACVTNTTPAPTGFCN